MTTFKVVISNGTGKHVSYINAIDQNEASNFVFKNNRLMRFANWYFLYILKK